MNLSAYFEKGWRLGVGIILINQENKIFMGERIDNKGAWQMPQGGVNIAKNESLDKNFVKDLSLKLFEWTNERWIITLSKIKGNMSIKEKEKDEKNKLLEKAKETKIIGLNLICFLNSSFDDIKQK